MTQIEAARQGIITQQMAEVARQENRDPEFIRAGVAQGLIVILANPAHPAGRPLGVGQGLRTKVNANLGTSTDQAEPELEISKAQAAVDAGADSLMDLSTGGDLARLRRGILEKFPQALGTVPVYETAVKTVRQGGRVVDMTPADMLAAIREQGREGVDFMTVHAGVTQEGVARLCNQGRITDIVSRGGAFIAEWMIQNNQENPYYSGFEEILAICREFDITLSLGDGLRPGCLEDATDRAQVQELIVLGELAQKARAAGVQAMIEGPGHVPLDQIQANIILQKRLCAGAPFYVLGPLVTDVAAGYDHISCAIGGAVAAAAGADFLCYVTPTEHLRLPLVEDVREGVVAARIAAHAADLAKGVPGAMEWDKKMARARKALDWNQQIELAIDPARAKKVRESASPKLEEVCTMCGDFCAMKGIQQYLKKRN